MSGFADKVVIVTGASSGIGKATAVAFAKHGSKLVIVGRNRENLNEVAQICQRNGAKQVHQVIAEFENLTEVDKIVEETKKTVGGLDILVNSAGVIKGGQLDSVKMEDFDWMFQINVKAMLRLTQNAMPYLVQSKGCVVNVSSLLSQYVIPDLLLYNMTKAAVDQFTKTVALEYAAKGVRVNAVNPGAVRTNIMGSAMGLSSEQMETYYSEAAAAHPLGRVGTAEEIAKAILFLASDDSAWTTGQCLFLDGGRSLTMN